MSAEGGRAGLAVLDLGMLTRAAEWGLLRPQEGRRYLMRGSFSLPDRDMRWLVEVAGGRAALSADELRPFTGDCVVLGAGGYSMSDVGARELLEGCTWQAITEAALVLELVPSLEDLAPSQAPQQVSPPF